MSREKECKCCHEWWYASVIKEDLCPNCYDYFKQLKQELEIKNQKIKNLYIDLKDWQDLEEKISTKYENVVSLLKEKDKEIELLKHLGNHETATEMFKENAKLIIEKRQLAIQELEKVKTLIQNAINFEKPNFVEVYDAINKQINDLKGESK